MRKLKYCLLLVILPFIGLLDVSADTFIPEFYEFRGGSYSGTLMAHSESNSSNIYVCANNSYCIMTLSAFLDTDTNYNNQPILTTVDVCSGVHNFPRYFDSSKNDTVFDGDLISYETIGTCKLYGQTVLKERLKISWTPRYNLADGYSNVYLYSLWSSFNQSGSEVAFQILSVKNDLYTSEIQAQDDVNKKNQEIIDKQDEAENTRKGIWGTIKEVLSNIIALPKKIVEFLVDALKSLFIPEDMSFLDDFKETLENKLGFIAQIPIAIIDFGLDLVNLEVEEMTSITFPTVEIMGVHFWPDMNVDITPILAKFKNFKYLTDVLCVTLCVNTLRKWRERFTGGGEVN